MTTPMLRIFVRRLPEGALDEIPGGPFAISPDELNAARSLFMACHRASPTGDPFAGIGQLRAATEILARVAPDLDPLDRDAVARGVVADRIRMQLHVPVK